MSTISKTETPTGQEETAILLEEYARRIATLQESLKQAGRIHPNEAVTLQEIKRVVEERNDLKRRLENAEMLIEKLKGLTERVERAEAVKESLKASLMEISGFSAYWKCLRGNEEAWENVWNIATDALISLRTTEESSVVGLIDGTPAKQPEDSANADGDWDILNDIETSLRAKTEVMKRMLESQTLSPELAALGRELVRLAEKSLEEVEE